MTRRVQVFVAVLCVAALVFFLIPASPFVFWGAALGVALVLSMISGGEGEGLPWRLFGSSSGEFLCDTCKYDNDRDCSRPERPNASRCPDYKSRIG